MLELGGVDIELDAILPCLIRGDEAGSRVAVQLTVRSMLYACRCPSVNGCVLQN